MRRNQPKFYKLVSMLLSSIVLKLSFPFEKDKVSKQENRFLSIDRIVFFFLACQGPCCFLLIWPKFAIS